MQTVASSPVTGNLVQNHGAAYSYGNAVANTTVYRAASGAYVFASGTNNWWRGLALNAHGQGEPDNRIAQATINAFADMGARPIHAAVGPPGRRDRLAVRVEHDARPRARRPSPSASP